MTRKRILLFFLTCFFADEAGISGSLLGQQLSWTYSWSGSLLGGAIGVLMAGWVAIRWGLIGPMSYLTVTVGGLAGLECGLAALYEIRSFPWPIIPILCFAASGLGAVVGDAIEGQKQEGKFTSCDSD